MTQELNNVANATKIQKETFVAMCNAIAGNYNTITGASIQYEIPKDYYRSSDGEIALQRLFAKMEHIVFDLYSPQSIPALLTRIAVKPVKVQSMPTGTKYEATEDIYGKGHFRWDWKAYTLDENELQAIRQYLGVAPTVKIAPFMTGKDRYEFSKLDFQGQAEYLLSRTGTTFTATFKGSEVPTWETNGWAHDSFTIVLKNASHRYRFNFYQSAKESNGMGTNKPTAYDILACLTKYDPYTFKDFCASYGYDEDSRSAYKTYKGCMKEYHNLTRLFTPEQMELLQEIN